MVLAFKMPIWQPWPSYCKPNKNPLSVVLATTIWDGNVIDHLYLHMLMSYVGFILYRKFDHYAARQLGHVDIQKLWKCNVPCIVLKAVCCYVQYMVLMLEKFLNVAHNVTVVTKLYSRTRLIILFHMLQPFSKILERNVSVVNWDLGPNFVLWEENWFRPAMCW